jgi:hypothetical protein
MKKVSVTLEIVTVALAILALVFRATLYWLIPGAPGEAYRLGDVLDFGLMVLLFFTGAVCAGLGVVLSMRGNELEQRLAFRPVLIGICSFVIYYLVHPHVPRLL